MKKNIAVVGCGHWGKNLVRNFYELGVLAAVCDPDKDVSEKYSLKYDAKNLSFLEIINDVNIDGVVIAAPAALHSSMAIQAMNSGKHVFVEKPLSLNQLDAESMIASSRKNNVHLMVGHLLQYHPIFIEIKNIVSSRELGPISYIYSNRLSFGKIRSEEDVLWSFAPHDISMILSLTDEEPKNIRTESTNIINRDIADISTIYMQFNSGIKAHISVSWLHPFKEQRLVVIGKHGMLVFDDTEIWDKKLALYSHSIGSNKNHALLKKSDIKFLSVPESEPLKNECLHFIDVVCDQSIPITNGHEGLRVLRVLSAATQSIRTNNSLFNLKDL